MVGHDFHIISDLHGSKRICGTRVSIDSILACLDRGDDLAAIQRSYPVLSVDQIQNTIAYINSHPREIAEHRELQAAKWDTLRGESGKKPDATFERLRARRAEQSLEKQDRK